MFSTATLVGGPHSINAVYNADGGNTNFATSSTLGHPANVTVAAAATTTTLATSANARVFGQSVTLTATVAVVLPGTGTPTGTVTFYDGPIASNVVETPDVPSSTKRDISQTASGEPIIAPPP